jgi:hypothetical protein
MAKLATFTVPSKPLGFNLGVMHRGYASNQHEIIFLSAGIIVILLATIE